jgi:hypothetical protein
MLLTPRQRSQNDCAPPSVLSIARVTKTSQQIRDRRFVHAHARYRIAVRVVRRKKTLVDSAQRTVGGQRFYLKHIERGPGNETLLERDRQRALIDDRAPGGVD